MFYWLFTEGKDILSSLLLPLTCLGLIAPLAFAWAMGIGIQREAEGSPLKTSGWQTVGKLFTYIIVNLAVITIYVTLVSTMALQRPTESQKPLAGFLLLLTGGPRSINQYRLLILGFGLCTLLLMLNTALWQGLRNGGWLREQVDRWRRPDNKRGEMGSAHLCTMREYRRYRIEDPKRHGITFLGGFWGENHLRVDRGWGKLCLSSEDAARGILALGAPGSGKTQSVILPVIADRMWNGHSLIVVDPQGELTPEITTFAKVTGHLVIVHDPTSSRGPRFNLAQGLNTGSVNSGSLAKSIAKVLVPAGEGDNKFWADSATDLLAACLRRFDNLGQIKSALTDLPALSKKLQEKKDDAALDAGTFTASVSADGKIATSIVATLNAALSGWSSEEVRRNTSTSDFNADLLVGQRAVIVLTCPEEMRDTYAPYLGAALQKLMSDLNEIAKKHTGGRLPTPCAIIMDEFPTLGKLDSVVKSVNLVRKRRMSIMIAAQTLGQFYQIYGNEGTKTLLTGLATQIVFGGCDYDTAKFYSDAAGTATVDANSDPQKSNLRQRPLLTTDEIINPQYGNSIILSRFVERNHALQVIVQAELTYMFERTDWAARIRANKHKDALLLERGLELRKRDKPAGSAPTAKPDIPALPTGIPVSGPALTAASLPTLPDTLPVTEDLDAIFGAAHYKETAAQMQAVRENALAGAGVKTASITELRAKHSLRAETNMERV